MLMLPDWAPGLNSKIKQSIIEASPRLLFDVSAGHHVAFDAPHAHP